jgi:predicted TIM-barrel fold metal-dependent hydrolase
LGRALDASFSTLTDEMRMSGFQRACAVGLAGQEGYNHVSFIQECRAHSQLVPIAGVSLAEPDVMEHELDIVRDLGFRGIKLHPRISNFEYTDARICDVFKAATRRNLPVFLCTYFQGPVEHFPGADPLYAVARALKAEPATKVVLLHGGTVELMRWMQFARHAPNILFDLSFTLMKYRGSSLDQDIAWLFDNFQNRTCIGVDHPEYRHAEVRRRFDEFAAQADHEARRLIGGLNLARFLGVEIE